MRVQLTGMAHGGEALGSYEGKVIFVPYTIPGEEVLVEVVEDRGRWARARLLEVLTPSPDRGTPLCPYFGPTACGGCQWQHIAYPAQLRFKAEILRDQLRRLGKMADPPVKPTIAVGEPWGYRLHAQLHPASEGLGYISADEKRVVAVSECPILHPLLSSLLSDLELDLDGLVRVSLRAAAATDQQMVIFEMEEDEPVALETDQPVSCIQLLADGTPLTLVGHTHLMEHVAGREYRISPPSFFQVNRAGAEALVQLVTSYLEPGPEDRLLDLYCGVGLFALALADRAGQVVGVEANPYAVADARHNAQARGAGNVEIVQGTVADVLKGWEGPVDLAGLDPPRSGCEPGTLEELVRLRPRRVVYISCDPATFSRDARFLIAAGYRLAEAQVVDFFPQTYHIESCALFTSLPLLP
jgi:23S rRNA (uracil1939-C5)-methyltransferase